MWTNIYADRRTPHDTRREALDALIGELCEAYLYDGPGSEAYYIQTLDPDGRSHSLIDEAETVIEDDGLTAPGPETTELLSGRQLGV